MRYTITIEIECESDEAAKSFMIQAKEEILDAMDINDDGEDIISWRVDPS